MLLKDKTEVRLWPILPTFIPPNIARNHTKFGFRKLPGKLGPNWLLLKPISVISCLCDYTSYDTGEDGYLADYIPFPRENIEVLLRSMLS